MDIKQWIRALFSKLVGPGTRNKLDELDEVGNRLYQGHRETLDTLQSMRVQIITQNYAKGVYRPDLSLDDILKAEGLGGVR